MPDRDFKMVEGRLEFKPYQMSATIEVPIIDDASAEKKESFKLVIADAQAKVALGTKVCPHHSCTCMPSLAPPILTPSFAVYSRTGNQDLRARRQSYGRMPGDDLQ